MWKTFLTVFPSSFGYLESLLMKIIQILTFFSNLTLHACNCCKYFVAFDFTSRLFRTQSLNLYPLEDFFFSLSIDLYAFSILPCIARKEREFPWDGMDVKKRVKKQTRDLIYWFYVWRPPRKNEMKRVYISYIHTTNEQANLQCLFVFGDFLRFPFVRILKYIVALNWILFYVVKTQTSSYHVISFINKSMKCFKLIVDRPLFHPLTLMHAKS